VNRVLGLVMKHYNGVARTLNKRPDCYGPLFAVDERHNDILWELRIVGFEKAVKPRPAAWQRLLTADTETARAISGLLTLADVDPRDARFSEEQLDALSAAAPVQIGPWIVTLNGRLANYSQWRCPCRLSQRLYAKSGATILVPAVHAKNTRNAAVSTDPRSSDKCPSA
jgi:uncharacterized protein